MYRIFFALLLTAPLFAQQRVYDPVTDDPQLVEAQKALTPAERKLMQSARRMLATNSPKVERILASTEPELLPDRLCLTIAKLEKDLFRRQVMKELLEEGNRRLKTSIEEQKIFNKRIEEEIRLLDLDIEKLKVELRKQSTRS